MSRRIDIELTSALPDNSWTWRAAGAKRPKGTLDGSILSDGASVGDVIKVEVEQEIDGITVVSVVGGRQKQDRDDVIELLPSEREFQPVIETRAKRDRSARGGGRRRDGDRRPRRDRGDGPRKRDDDGRRDRKGRGDGDRGGQRSDDGDRRQRRGPSFTPPPEVPQRPKPKRLKPGKANRTAVLAELPEEQRSIAELALQGMGAVRQRLKDENAKAAAEGRAVMPEGTVLRLAEDMLPKLRVAEWRDRAEAALRQLEHLDLRDLRSVVAAAGDPIVARDESTRQLASELSTALTTKQEQELHLWFGDVDAALAVGRVIRALRLSSQPPKAGVPFPTDIAQRLVDSANASLAPMDPPDRWIAVLEAAAFSPVRTSIAPARKPDQVSDELLATVRRLAPALPQVAALFDVEVDPKAPMPKPLRPGPRKSKNERGKPSGGGAERSSRKSERRPKQAAGRSDASSETSATETGAASPQPEFAATEQTDKTEPAEQTDKREQTDENEPSDRSEPAEQTGGVAAASAPADAAESAPPEAPSSESARTEDQAPATDRSESASAESTSPESTSPESTSPESARTEDQAPATDRSESASTESTSSESTSSESTSTESTSSESIPSEPTSTEAPSTESGAESLEQTAPAEAQPVEAESADDTTPA